MDSQTFNVHQDTWNRCLMLEFVSAHIPSNAIWNFKLQQSHRASRSDLILPSVTTVSNICWSEYELTVQAVIKQLPLRNKGILVLDGWISMNNLAITSVIPYYMDQNWALREVQLGWDDVNLPLFSGFAHELRMICQGWTYWSQGWCIFEGRAWSVQANRRLFASNSKW